MHKTRLPLRTWFWAAYLVSTFQPGISAKQLQRQLGLSRHETAWAMLHKLRGAMIAPERTLLSDEVEIDEFFLGGYEEGLKGGRQRGKKTLCGVAIEGPRTRLGRLRLAVLADASRPTLLQFTKEQLLPRAHRAISNLKAWMHGTHRGVSPDHMPAYLDEFVFRHHRRGTPMASFQTLLGLGLAHDPITYREIIDRAA